MRSDTWAEDVATMKALAEREVHLQRQKNDQHPEKRIVQVDPRALLDLVDENARLRRELAQADENDVEIRLALAKARKERDEAESNRMRLAVEIQDAMAALNVLPHEGATFVEQIVASAKQAERERDSIAEAVRAFLRELERTLGPNYATGPLLAKREIVAMRDALALTPAPEPVEEGYAGMYRGAVRVLWELAKIADPEENGEPSMGLLCTVNEDYQGAVDSIVKMLRAKPDPVAEAREAFIVAARDYADVCDGGIFQWNFIRRVPNWHRMRDARDAWLAAEAAAKEEASD